MPTPELRWIRSEVSAPRGSRLRMLAVPAMAAMDAPEMHFELPDLSGYPTPIEKARLLLHTAAEIEHALLAQYLYAAYSLKSDTEVTDLQQQQALQAWRRGLVGIAKEEMGHLMSVQNLLLFTRLPLNFEREDFPPRKSLYPFAMHLEPLTQVSLAKYVVAESPVTAAGIDDIIQQATGAAGMIVNRVGVLYGLLGVVFSTPTGIDKNAAGGDEWYEMLRELAQRVYLQQPPAAWHLPSKAFDRHSTPRQAKDQGWAPGSAMRVFPVSTRKDCLEALRDIGLQGEGPTTQSADSHFERFRRIYRGEGLPLPFPNQTGWTPTRDIPTDPKVVTDPAQAGPQDISHPQAVAWARLADQRYGLLLGLLEQYFHTDPNDRDWLQTWCLPAMVQLRGLADQLSTLDRAAGSPGKAMLPFTLPSELHLPDTAEARRQLHLARLQASVATANALLAQNPGDTLVGWIKQTDVNLLPKFGGDPIPGPDPGAIPGNAEAEMKKLLDEKQAIAKLVHGDIPATAAAKLSQLFKDKDYDAVLNFLRTGTSIRPPFAGKKLIEPGKPAESGFFLQITDPNGVMAGQFDAEEIQVVADWILSLTTVPPVTPPPPPPPDPATAPRQEMLALLKKKRSLGQIMHSAISAGSGSLSQLFQAENYDGILQFLESAKSIRDPFTGKPLIVAKQPAESAFYLHLTDPNGVMAGRFTADEIPIVERWINSLTPISPPGPTSGSGAVITSAKRLATGLSNPVFVTAPPGDRQRLFLVEQTGAIRIFDLASGQLAAQPFLQVANISTGGERGLLGLAFHPQYATTGLLFVNCTNSQGHTEIRRYKVSNANPDAADPASGSLVLRVEQPFANHNGGWIAFGPRDGFLYIALGDGGSANDPGNRAQNLNLLLGKLLRIDVDRDDFPGDANRNYGVPANNPFVGQANVRPEIWASGLRNPWRCGFDRVTGDLLIGDVGQNQREEINFQPASSTGGENYGWRLKEGTLVTGLETIGTQSLVEPIHEYGRSEGFAIVGGYVYRGAGSPAMAGTYFFADFGGRMWSFRRDGNVNKNLTERTAELTAGGGTLDSISSFGEDGQGELYYTTLDGNLYQLQGTPIGVAGNRWKDVAKIRIHPAIGIARVGNAGFVNGVAPTPADPADYFIGPERPFESVSPPGGYKRNGRVRRQAARFRLFAYDATDQLIGEVTANDADITWSVELANKKASFRQFDGPSPNGSLRNPHVPAANRTKLEITPGLRTLTGPNQAAAFDTGSFTDWKTGQPKTVTNISLGGMQTEDSGRLLVLAGSGRSESPWNKGITHFANNNGWFDDMADGPVTATVRLKSTNAQPSVVGAWVICAPPKFAPALRNIITLYDTLFQVAVNKSWRQVPAQPSFRHDIYPILARAMNVKWLMAAPGTIHDTLQLAFPPADQNGRQRVLRRLRHPDKGQGLNGPGMNMPVLFDDENNWEPNGDQGLSVTKAMYEILTKWRDGQFVNDWNGEPPQPPAEITPAGLDQAALENCAGAAFFPGIEASWLLRDVYDYLEPFRLNPANLRAGDVSQQMAVPWQADFYKCTSGGSTIGWWPQQRPDEVFPETGGNQVDWIRNKIDSHQDMVKRWHELGFVVWNGTKYVETERNPDSPPIV